MYKEVFEEYLILDFLPYLRESLPKKAIFLKDIIINCSSVRLQLFTINNCECVRCGNRASKFVLEKLDLLAITPHLNMYGEREDGSELLFTKDHVLPKSLSGSDQLFNMQIMCADCNSEKGHRVSLWDIPKIIIQIIKGQASLIKILQRSFK